ncbi:uncharacterized protein si:dkeyp-118a3.2 [Electrophorus electricus]|uniref:uncharacterized protein si:dkeyp-118a3.2 n=1 Tax=Electrophorus electricus TaxID=8005 RepID=UPI0015D0B7E9|nr:uncharacterized protein si:dkeyp-118a3.2 [Electrophorus electricus]
MEDRSHSSCVLPPITDRCYCCLHSEMQKDTKQLCVNVCVGSGAVPEKACEEGRGGVKYDVANADTTIPAEEPITMADLMEESQVQQETVTMTTLQTDTAAKNS